MGLQVAGIKKEGDEAFFGGGVRSQSFVRVDETIEYGNLVTVA